MPVFPRAGQLVHPLFIFANPMEDEAPPDPDAENVVYFGPGIHEPGEMYVDDPLPDGTEVYIDGGAYVIGFLKFEANAEVTIRGRGVLSGVTYPWVPTWSNHLIEIQGGAPGGPVVIEGIVITDSPKSNIISRPQTTVDNVKILGWHRNTDGMTVGAGSRVTNSFFKVYDDIIKLFYDDIEVNGVTIWLQPTGSAFQLSWNLNRGVSGAMNSSMGWYATLGSVELIPKSTSWSSPHILHFVLRRR